MPSASIAGYNLALKRTASQSETLWNYEASLAVDGDANTCSFTPQSDVQRWWQVRSTPAYAWKDISNLAPVCDLKHLN